MDPTAPPALRGAALGWLWSMGALADEADAEARAVRALRRASAPESIGELLGGLFALAREEVIGARGLVGALDGILGAQSMREFLIAVPSLRLAFAWFPPRERDAIARVVLDLHGAEGGALRPLRRLAAAPEALARAIELEGRVDAIEARYGLAP